MGCQEWAFLTGSMVLKVHSFYENNAFAVATVMAIPLLVLWLRETQNKYLRFALMGSIPLCMASALSSWSRGGLLNTGGNNIGITLAQ